MRFLADDDRNRWRTEKSVAFRVPARLLEHAVPSRGERAKIGDGRAGNKGAAAFRREPEDVEQPTQRDLLEQGSCRSRAPKTGVLVPGSREPVTSDRNRKRATDDKAKEPRPGHRRRPGRTDFIQEPQRVRRIALAIRQRLIECLELFDRRSGRSNRTFVDSFQVTDRALGRVAEKFFVHRLRRHSCCAPENERPKIRRRNFESMKEEVRKAIPSGSAYRL